MQAHPVLIEDDLPLLETDEQSQAIMHLAGYAALSNPPMLMVALPSPETVPAPERILLDPILAELMVNDPSPPAFASASAEVDMVNLHQQMQDFTDRLVGMQMRLRRTSSVATQTSPSDFSFRPERTRKSLMTERYNPVQPAPQRQARERDWGIGNTILKQ